MYYNYKALTNRILIGEGMNMIIVMEKTQLQDLLRSQTIQLLLLDYDENHIFFLFIKRKKILPMYCCKNTPENQ